MTYTIIEVGPSRSFPHVDEFLQRGFETPAEGARGIVVLGKAAGAHVESIRNRERFDFIAVELEDECLGGYFEDEDVPTNVVGFARFRLGDAEPTHLVELVHLRATGPHVLAAARQAFESAGLTVAVCFDAPGRIVNRLVRPFYNAALRRLDEGLADAKDLDETLKLGLGYPEGPIELLRRTGLHHHWEVTAALHRALGGEDLLPARRARNAAAFKRRDIA